MTRQCAVFHGREVLHIESTDRHDLGTSACVDALGLAIAGFMERFIFCYHKEKLDSGNQIFLLLSSVASIMSTGNVR